MVKRNAATLVSAKSQGRPGQGLLTEKEKSTLRRLRDSTVGGVGLLEQRADARLYYSRTRCRLRVVQTWSADTIHDRHVKRELYTKLVAGELGGCDEIRFGSN